LDVRDFFWQNNSNFWCKVKEREMTENRATLGEAGTPAPPPGKAKRNISFKGPEDILEDQAPISYMEALLNLFKANVG
jgi:hypothetical protein